MVVNHGIRALAGARGWSVPAPGRGWYTAAGFYHQTWFKFSRYRFPFPSYNWGDLVILHTFTMGTMAVYLNGKPQQTVGYSAEISRRAWCVVSGVPVFNSQPHPLFTWAPGYVYPVSLERWRFGRL